MYNELREMRQQIYSLPKENRDVAKGILVYKKITTLERLDDMYAAGRSFINQYHKNWNEDKNAMKAIDKLKIILIKKMKTAFLVLKLSYHWKKLFRHKSDCRNCNKQIPG